MGGSSDIRERIQVKSIKQSSLAVQWLGLHIPSEGPGSILGLRTKIPQFTWCGQKKKKKIIKPDKDKYLIRLKNYNL